MSLAKIPFIFLYGLSTYDTLSPPNPATSKEVERTITDCPSSLELLMSTSIQKNACWMHAAIELIIILAAAIPNSTVTESVLTFLLPLKDPNRIFLSPMSFLGVTLVVIGTIIRVQCYHEMGKHFTLQVTVLKDHKLITSGPYSYVRHPSYTGAYIYFAGVALWYTAEGSWLRESEVYKKPLTWVCLAPVVGHLFLVNLVLFRRIAKEDEMMKKGFGKEWAEWARKVPDRMVPGVY